MRQLYGKKINDLWDFYSVNFRAGKQVSGEEYRLPNGINHAPTPEQLIADGRRLLADTDYNQTTHKLVVGGYSIVDAETMRQDIVARSLDEITADLAILREKGRKDIRKTANFYLDQITAEYSNTRLTRFQKYKDEVDRGNGTYFERMAGASGLTGSQFMLSYVKPMIIAGDRFIDQVIGIETTLLETLKTTVDVDLKKFDYKTMWDDVDDFVDSGPDSIDPALWALIKSKLQMKVW